MQKSWILYIITGFLVTFAQAEMRDADAAMRSFDESFEKWEQRFTYTQDEATRIKLLEVRPNPRRTTQIILKSIGTQLNEPNAMRAISWIYRNDANYLKEAESIEAGKAVRSALIRSHYDRAGAGDLCITISQNFSPQDLPFLEKVAKQSPTKEEQGMASLALSIALSQLGDDPTLLAKRLEHLRTAIKTAPEDAEINGKKVTDIIGDQLYVIQYLSKGRKAPNFSGKSIGGDPVSLATSTGKVTAIAFWTEQDGKHDSWISILQNMQKVCDQAGAKMIGVYTGTPANLRQKIADREVTWENAYDQDEVISKQFRINRTPTVFLLDKEGRIQTVGEPNALINLSIQALADSSE